MKKILKAIGCFFLLCLTGKSDKAVDDGVCDYSGQGRNKYGR